MTGTTWDQTRRAAQMLAAARAERDPQKQQELRRIAFALLRGEEAGTAEAGPTWPEVLISHSK